MLVTNDNKNIDYVEIGARLRSYRIGRRISPEELSARLHISRAALYRAEKGEISKIEMLHSIAVELDVSLPTLLGVGVEYIDNAISFFERMRQIEDECDQIIGMFSPVSYLLTSPEYDIALEDILRESLASDEDDNVSALLDVLKQRKTKFQKRRPLIASIVSSLDLIHFLRSGLEGGRDAPKDILDKRRQSALVEVQHIRKLVAEPEIGVQIGIASEPIPSTSFQIVRQRTKSTVTISPFRLGQNPNIRNGVGLITSAPEALNLHENIAERLWSSSMRGADAVRHLDELLDEYGPLDGVSHK
ncbi:helix-turn-helix domain-containing protein [Qingshengfaniella alkalisoli]|uniref:Helix-turn-helix transcriptional regulator n=1 Tax=Qingshengfaniella alkalisoli TaxID=2599296 RepID=A0A5B8IT08_9RHOB|nr:helix-turn-helix transcriptional regulator [Qingshengfaniella alkalisoli]QDY69382.1 helix-turn-helix transcriptional regulator [Qingshengfaniella alkalisoli]